MMENGPEESKTATECGKVYLVIAIWVNGKIVKLMEMEYINGRMVIDTKDVLSIGKEVEREFQYIPPVKNMMGILRMIYVMAMEYSLG